jgi:hypothetical protein
MPDVMKVLLAVDHVVVAFAPRRGPDRLATSDPPPGSVIASAEIFSPERIAGSTRRLSASLPCAARSAARQWCANFSDACRPPELGVGDLFGSDQVEEHDRQGVPP